MDSLIKSHNVFKDIILIENVDLVYSIRIDNLMLLTIINKKIYVSDYYLKNILKCYIINV